MSEENPLGAMSDDARLASLGYRPQLNRVLGSFANFSVAFTYLSPMVGIYSLFALGVAAGGPRYLWLTWIPVAGMLLVALVFGELASHYPVAGALYQYSKFSVGPSYGWFVGWFYGMALLITVAAVDTGVVTYTTALAHNWFGWSYDPTNHLTILVITAGLVVIQTSLNVTGARVMGARRAVRRVRRDRRHAGHRDHPGHRRLPPRARVPVQHPGRGERRQQRPRPRLRRQLADRGGADRGAGAGLHLLRLRVRRGHLGGDQGRRRQGAPVDAAGADLGRGLVVRPDRGPAAGHAVGQGPGREDRRRRRGAVHPRRAPQRPAGLPAADDHLRVLLVRHLGAGRGQSPRVLVRPRRRAARLRVDGTRPPPLQDPRRTRCWPARWSRCCSCCWSSTPPPRT